MCFIKTQLDLWFQTFSECHNMWNLTGHLKWIGLWSRQMDLTVSRFPFIMEGWKYLVLCMLLSAIPVVKLQLPVNCLSVLISYHWLIVWLHLICKLHGGQWPISHTTSLPVLAGDPTFTNQNQPQWSGLIKTNS